MTLYPNGNHKEVNPNYVPPSSVKDVKGIQFEYVTIMKKWDLATEQYVDYGLMKFLTVLETFEHHYTGERMCRIREEWVLEDGHGMSDEKIVREASVLKLMGEKL